jgi:hypothetical protein
VCIRNIYRPYDYKIVLESDEKEFIYSPLYKISAKELEATKQYLFESLDKSFIKASQIFFIVLVFFVKKPNRNLWFYIDYYKLNSFSRKDQYLLLLIDETLARISCAKIFLKRNIRLHFG